MMIRATVYNYSGEEKSIGTFQDIEKAIRYLNKNYMSGKEVVLKCKCCDNYITTIDGHNGIWTRRRQA